MAPDRESMIMNIPTVPYHEAAPDEYRADPFDSRIPFNWRD